MIQHVKVQTVWWLFHRTECDGKASWRNDALIYKTTTCYQL